MFTPVLWPAATVIPLMRITSMPPFSEVFKRATKMVWFALNPSSLVTTLAARIIFTVCYPSAQSSHLKVLGLTLQSSHPPNKRNRSPSQRHYLRPLHNPLLIRRSNLLRPRPYHRSGKDKPIQHQHPATYHKRARRHSLRGSGNN